MESTSVPPRPRGRVKLPHPLYTLWQRMPDTPRNEQTLAAPSAAESPPPLIWANVLMFALSFAGALILVPWYGLTHGFSPAAWAACVLLACGPGRGRSEEHTSELQSPVHLVCRLLLEKKKGRRAVAAEVHHREL